MTLDTLALGRRPEGPTLLQAQWVMGHVDGAHVLYRDGQLVFDGARIVYAGHRYSGAVARRIDLGPALVGPGFVDLDALSDLDTTVLAYDNQPAWKKGRVWPETYVARGPYEMYTPQELAFQKRYAFAQLLRNGITTAAPVASLFYRAWGETVEEFADAADIAAELGLRVYLGPAYRSGGMVVKQDGAIEPRFDESRGLEGLKAALAFQERYEGSHGGLVRALLAPDRVETCTADLLRATMRAARERGLPVRLHMAQGAMEVDTVRALHGMGAPGWLHSLGLLSDRLIAPHATHATPEDLALYGDHGVSIVHCPLVSARGGSVLRSFRRCRDMGINVAMGTDTAPPDMLANLAAGMMLCRVVEGRADACRAEEFYDAATLGGARALGRDDIGRLAAGCKADIVVFDLASVRTGPAIDPVQTLMIGGHGSLVKAVFVDGRLSARDGQVAGFDAERAQARAQAQFDGLVRKYPERTHGHPPVSEIFSGSYREC
ncbi:amidohydrolase family protein [uncultured Castellaniella sp.]|uniref:amidohydrolase family protein n=1 Tax=uncultured Castellaniella sp. TaxID=647907 RepID=UPI002623898C|nr:amidohydrolase family protein [uncultured Castellaniella sp.]